jgi:NAD(P)-dependent dehydrogenase (short-subunit alcohol dehydrogenase family)
MKRVVLTGASGGIGKAIAVTLLEDGYSLDLICSSEDSINGLLEGDLGQNDKVTYHVVNLTESKEIKSFTQEYKGKAWGLINCAGVCNSYPLLTSEYEDPFDGVLKTNLYGPYLLTKGLLPYISEPGRIVNIASQLGKEGRAGYSAYCASKFGLIGMTKCWAKELGAKGITVNAVSPGWVDTEMSGIDMARMAKENNKSTEEYYSEICEPLELKRFNTPQEVANLVFFLLSEKSAGITGRDWLMQTVWNQE